MAIGRLDEDSEGLLLLTTSGVMSERARSSIIEKEYYAQVDGDIDEVALDRLRNGVLIGIRNVKYMTKPCKVTRLISAPDFAPRTKKIRDDRHGPTCWVSIVLTEGKFRQIRKMTAAVGFPTLRLFRVRFGNLLLGDLAPGMVKEVPESLFDFPPRCEIAII
jgi:23S rRNA pseudouridine2457 synthase